MRALPVSLSLLFLVACAAEHGPQSQPPQTSSEGPEARPAAFEHTLPARTESKHALTTIATMKGDVARGEVKLSYGLAGVFPSQVTLEPGVSYVNGKACRMDGQVRWQAIQSVAGDAARVELRDGVLVASLQGKGETVVVLSGEVTGQPCAGAPEALPLEHRLVLRVRPVAGFNVSHLESKLRECPAYVFPAGAILAPQVKPVDDEGDEFDAVNAPAPVALTLRSAGAITAGEAGGITCAPGKVTITAATALPVSGLAAFDVAGPEALTAVSARFSLRKAASKGFVGETIEQGSSHKLFFGEQNLVDLELSDAKTSLGPLCGRVPRGWVEVKSATPGTCSPRSGDLYGGAMPIASIDAVGECQVEAAIDEAGMRWSVGFSTGL